MNVAIKSDPRRRFFAAAGVVVALLVGWFSLRILGVPGPWAAPPAQAADCGQVPGEYFANSAPAGSNHFGPAATEEFNATKAELHRRRCLDPALVVAHEVYQSRSYGTVESRRARTAALAQDGTARKNAVAALEAKEARAVSVEIVIMEGSYRTMYMVPGNPPEIFVGEAGSPSFKVLKFTYSDGSWEAYKLDCGYQPVEQQAGDFPTQGKPWQPGEPTPTPEKCPPDLQGFCGTPLSGPEQQPVGDNNPEQVAGTPGYTPGNAESTVSQQPVSNNNSSAPTRKGSKSECSSCAPAGSSSGPSGSQTGTKGGTGNPSGSSSSGSTSSGDPGGFG